MSDNVTVVGCSCADTASGSRSRGWYSCKRLLEGRRPFPLRAALPKTKSVDTSCMYLYICGLQQQLQIGLAHMLKKAAICVLCGRQLLELQEEVQEQQYKLTGTPF